jgi:hypothetical protein
MARGPERRRRPRRSPSRPPSERRSKEDRRAFAILGFASLTVAAVGVLLYLGRSPALDETTGCGRGDLTPPSHTVVLIDQTDRLTRGQINYVKVLIQSEYQRLQPQAKMTVRSISSDPDTDVREFARCRVRRGSEVAGVTTNPEMIEESFRRIVGDSLNEYLNDLAGASTADSSPIVETVAAVADAADFGPNVGERRLVIVSDMAQHSPGLNQYAEPGTYSVSGDVRSVFGRELEGVQVRIHYVRRPELARLQTPSHRAFWTEWFRRAGADVELGWGLQMVDARQGARGRPS